VAFLIGGIEAAEPTETDRPWPFKGQELEAWMAVVPDEEDPAFCYVEVMSAPEEVREVMYDASGTVVTEEVFDMDEVPVIHGLYKVKLKFWQEGSGEDMDFGFNIVSKEKI